MHDPQLSPGRFLLDRVVGRECLFSAQDVAASSGTVVEGGFARCSARDRFQLILPLHDPDLSRFSSLSVTLRNLSPARLLAGVRLVHEYETQDVPRPAASFTGGGEPVPPETHVQLNFPSAGFGWYGGKRSWESVTRIEFTLTFEKTYDGPDDFELLIGPIDGETRLTPRGPRLTEDGLADALDGDVDDAVMNRIDVHASGDVSRDPPSLYTSANIALHIPAPHPYPRDAADDILGGRVMGQRLSRPVPWDADPIGAHEWTHFLNRHHFMRELVRAFAATRDARYVRAADELIAHWIESNPVPIGSNGGAGPSWETLTAAWRLREWLWVVGICWPHDSFRRETKIAMLGSIWEHARSLMDHQGHPTNWIVVESAALALAGMCFSWFRDADKWRQEGLMRLEREVGRQFFSDGVHFEISPLYQAICVGALLEVREAADTRGIALPLSLREGPHRCLDYLAALCRPDFTWPSLNDSGGARGDFRALAAKAGELLGREDLIWIGSRGRRGSRPDPRSAVFEDAGIAVMRSGYDTDANVLVFRAGPAGAGHVHADALSLDVTALGVPRLIDPGVTTYAPDPLTDHYRSPEAHSMVLVDACGPERGALPFRQRVRPAGEGFAWERRGRIEVCSGVQVYAQGGAGRACSVARTTVFVDSRYWVVRDAVFGDGSHDVTACWQFAPGRVEIDLRSLTVRCADARGPSFEVIPLAGPSVLDVEMATGVLFPPRGWVSIDAVDVPAAGLRFSATADLPLCLIWLLMPYCGGRSSGVRAARTDCADGRVCVEIAWEFGQEERLLFGAHKEQDAISGAARAFIDVALES